jgi:uncharacterized protein YeaO (DUF488 family)
MAGHPGPLRIKRVYDPPAEEDGTRVLVDRVWPRGITKERAAADVWLKEIAPSTALRKRFGHDPKKWAAFQADYRAELDANEETVRRLEELAAKGTVTLVYGARDTTHNQAAALLEYMNERLGRAHRGRR